MELIGNSAQEESGSTLLKKDTVVLLFKKIQKKKNTRVRKDICNSINLFKKRNECNK